MTKGDVWSGGLNGLNYINSDPAKTAINSARLKLA
jgi:hypothetical protein